MINWYDKVNIIRPDLSGYRRIIAVSDIHANLDYFQHLLEKIQFGKEDALVIVQGTATHGPISWSGFTTMMTCGNDGRDIWR